MSSREVDYETVANGESTVPVKRETARLREMAARLDAQVDRLRQRLDPLMAPSEPTPMKESALKSARLTGEHSSFLAGLGDHLGELSRQLDEIAERLEI